MLKNLFWVLLMVFAIACQQEHNKHSHASHKHEANHHHTESANDYMHQSKTEDLIKRFESPERNAYQQPEKVLNYLGDIGGKTIMDIGTGSGYFSVKLAAKGANVIAADVNEDFLNHVQSRIKTAGIQNIEPRKIPYDSPGLNNQEADIVFMVNTYHHIENRPEYFAKVKTGTKEAGSLVIIDFFKSDIPVGPPTSHKISMDQVIAELKEAGYTRFDITVDLLPYQYIIKAE